jgi:hypothetical protein
MYGTESSIAAGEGQSIGKLIFQEMKKSRQESRKQDEKKEKQDIESQLKKAFDNFSFSFKEIRKSITIQNKIVSERLEVEKDIVKEVQILSGLLTQRNVLQQSFNQIQSGSLLEKKSTPTPQVTEVATEPTSTEEPNKPQGKKANLLKKAGGKLFKAVASRGKGAAQTKLAEGGVVPGKTEPSYKSLPFHEVMSMPLRASSLAAIGILSDLIKSAGAVSAFAEPMIKDTIYPYASSFGVTNDDLDRLLGSPLDVSKDKKDALLVEFSKTWGMFLNDEKFLSMFIDPEILRQTEDDDPYTGEWQPILDLIKKVEAVTHKYNAVNYGSGPGFIDGLTEMTIREADAAAQLYHQKYPDSSGALGQYQFMSPIAQAKDAGLNPDTDKFSPANQDKMAVWIIENKRQGNDWKKRKINDDVFMKNLAAEWRGLPANSAGQTYQDSGAYRNKAHATWEEFQGAVQKVKQKSFARGGKEGNNTNPLSPYLISGPESGFDTTIQGIPVTLHGEEIIVPSANGFQVFPVRNRQYDFSEDPFGVIQRWKEIAHGSSTTTTSFASGGVSEGVKAIKHDEALSSLSRGKNDYIVNRGPSVISSVPWSKISASTPVHAYETGVSGDRTTIGWGMTYYDSITAGTKAVKPGDVVTKAKADSLLTGLVNNYVTTLKGEKWYKKYWNKMSAKQQGGLLAYGYNQPAHLLGTGAPKMYAALNRGDMNAVAANVDRGLPEREKNEKQLILSGSKNLNKVPASTSTNPKVVVNNFGQKSQAQPVIQTIQSVTSSIVRVFYDPLKHRNEKRLRNTK